MAKNLSDTKEASLLDLVNDYKDFITKWNEFEQLGIKYGEYVNQASSTGFAQATIYVLTKKAAGIINSAQNGMEIVSTGLEKFGITLPEGQRTQFAKDVDSFAQQHAEDWGNMLDYFSDKLGIEREFPINIAEGKIYLVDQGIQLNFDTTSTESALNIYSLKILNNESMTFNDIQEALSGTRFFAIKENRGSGDNDNLPLTHKRITRYLLNNLVNWLLRGVLVDL